MVLLMLDMEANGRNALQAKVGYLQYWIWQLKKRTKVPQGLGLPDTCPYDSVAERAFG